MKKSRVTLVKTREEMEEIAKKLDGFDVGGRTLKCCPDINAEQLVRMCNKQGLDPGRSGDGIETLSVWDNSWNIKIVFKILTLAQVTSLEIIVLWKYESVRTDVYLLSV